MRVAMSVVLCLVACGQPDLLSNRQQPLPDPPCPDVGPRARANERIVADIRFAAFRYLIESYGGNRHQSFVCILLGSNGQGGEPSADLLQKLHNVSGLRVVPSSACDVTRHGVFLRSDHGAGSSIELRVERLERSGRRAIVTGGYYEASLSASGNTLTVEQQPDDSWKVTDAKEDWVS